MSAILFVLLLVGLFVLPFVPLIAELCASRDVAPLAIDEDLPIDAEVRISAQTRNAVPAMYDCMSDYRLSFTPGALGILCVFDPAAKFMAHDERGLAPGTARPERIEFGSADAASRNTDQDFTVVQNWGCDLLNVQLSPLGVEQCLHEQPFAV